MSIIGWFLLGIVGVVAHILTKIIGQGDETFHALSQYWTAKSLSVILSLLLYMILFAAWQWSSSLEFLGWAKGEVNGAIALVGYFSNSIIGHLTKRAPFNK